LLSEDGVMVIGCPGSLSYMSEELRDLNRMVYQTLQQVFSFVKPVPGDFNLWMGSSSESLPILSVDALVDRWEGRGLETRMITGSHIRLKFNQRYVDWLWNSLGEVDQLGESFINRDFHPIGLFYGLAYWHAMFSPQLTGLFTVSSRLTLLGLSIALLGCGLLFYAIVKRTGKGKDAVLPLVIATTGFAGMTADLGMIFAFQSLHGYVYHWIALFITAFMVGLSLGGSIMTRSLDHIQREKRVLVGLELVMILYWILVPILLKSLFTHSEQPLVLTFSQGILLLLNAVGGFLVGAQFPLVNRMLLRGGEERAGLLYASDLVGAFLGSILVAVIFIPVLGILETCLLVALLKLGSLLLVGTLHRDVLIG
jgi:spermidine synthase